MYSTATTSGNTVIYHMDKGINGYHNATNGDMTYMGCWWDWYGYALQGIRVQGTFTNENCNDLCSAFGWAYGGISYNNYWGYGWYCACGNSYDSYGFASWDYSCGSNSVSVYSTGLWTDWVCSTFLRQINIQTSVVLASAGTVSWSQYYSGNQQQCVGSGWILELMRGGATRSYWISYTAYADYAYHTTSYTIPSYDLTPCTSDLDWYTIKLGLIFTRNDGSTLYQDPKTLCVIPEQSTPSLLYPPSNAQFNHSKVVFSWEPAVWGYNCEMPENNAGYLQVWKTGFSTTYDAGARTTSLTAYLPPGTYNWQVGLYKNLGHPTLRINKFTQTRSFTVTLPPGFMCDPGFDYAPATGCTPCPYGSWSLGNTSCYYCPSNCVECNDNETCSRCAAGFAHTSDMVCTPCASTQYSDGFGACASCTVLSLGCSKCDNKTGDCTHCNTGKGYVDKTVGCTTCPDNTYNPGIGYCFGCRLGFGCLDCDAMTGDCTLCPPGKMPSGTRCVECPTGQYSTDGLHCSTCAFDSTCSTCDPLTGTCTYCPEGTEVNGAQCRACGQGKYSDGSEPCQACDLANGCTACNSANGMCTSCPAGKGVFAGGCAPCSENQYSPAGSTECSACKLGNECLHCSSSDGSCTSCPPDYSISGDGCSGPLPPAPGSAPLLASSLSFIFLFFLSFLSLF
jgi:hypothetical protein